MREIPKRNNATMPKMKDNSIFCNKLRRFTAVTWLFFFEVFLVGLS